jgi:ABC-type phosphate transport system auxiliary subunit
MIDWLDGILNYFINSGSPTIQLIGIALAISVVVFLLLALWGVLGIIVETINNALD